MNNTEFKALLDDIVGRHVDAALINASHPSLFDSSALVSPPAPRVEAVTCNVEPPERGMLDMFPYEGPKVPRTEIPFRYITMERYRIA